VVRVDVLGPVRIVRDGVDVVPGPPLRCAVLAMLVSRQGHRLTLGELVKGLWGEGPPVSAQGSIHTYVSGLRSVLDQVAPDGGCGELVDCDRSGYLLKVGSDDVDAWQAEQLRVQAREQRESGDLPASLASLDEALSLWRGEVLARVPGPFAELERLRLTDLRWNLLEERAEVGLALGRHAEIATELAALVREQPLREGLVGSAMTASYRVGRQAEALAIFHQVRTTLAEELGIDPGPGLAKLYERILSSDPELLATNPPTPTVAVGRGYTVPAQLPHDVAGFTGRATELAWLRSLVPGFTAGGDSGTPPVGAPAEATAVISAIDGCGGVGKTALAVQLCHEVAGSFPDGQLYLDLRGFDPMLAPLTASDALSRLLTGLGLDPKQLPDDVDVLAARYRSALAGKRMLVLLDNAASTEQVRPLLQGTAGCFAVVTSRGRLGGLVARHGARRLTLDVLSRAEAVELLERVIGVRRVSAELKAAEELVELCGRFPIALRIAAERVLAREGVRIADLVAELRVEHDRLDGLAVDEDETAAVRNVFSWSYRTLEPEVARLFRLLSVHAGSEVGVHAAAAVAGRPVSQTRALLRTLTAVHLLEEVALHRYHCHDLLRLYARELANRQDGELERTDATRRMLGFYLHSADRAAHAAAPGRPAIELLQLPAHVEPLSLASTDDALGWFEAEYSNLVSAIRAAVTASEDEAAWQLADRCRIVFEMRAAAGEWVELLSLALAAACRVADRRGQAVICNQRGVAKIVGGREHAGALDDLERARALYEELGDRRGAARALGNIGTLYLDSFGRPEEAVRCQTEVTATLEAIGDRDGHGRALSHLAELYSHLERHDDAIAAATHAMQIREELDDVAEHALSQANVASSYLWADRAEEAVPLFTEAIGRLESFGAHRWIADALVGRASAYRRLGKYELTLVDGNRAIELLGSNDPLRVAEVKFEMGRALRELNRTDQARGLMSEATELSDKIGSPFASDFRAELAALDAAISAGAQMQ
jgi:DNA-binding SARP family transcriptional activator/tetratricopeptide (TPR) repeat protein